MAKGLVAVVAFVLAASFAAAAAAWPSARRLESGTRAARNMARVSESAHPASYGAWL